MSAGNQRRTMVSSILCLVALLLLALPADFQGYPNVPYISSGMNRPYNPLYSPPPPPMLPYSSAPLYGSPIYGVPATQPAIYPPPTPSNCLSYYCYRSALPSLGPGATNSTTTAAPVVGSVCGQRNYLICTANKPMSTEYSGASSTPYQQYQNSNFCPAYFCQKVPKTTTTLVADSCDSFSCEIIE